MGFFDSLGESAKNVWNSGVRKIKEHQDEISAVGNALKKGAQIAGKGIETATNLANDAMAREMRANEVRERRAALEAQKRGGK